MITSKMEFTKEQMLLLLLLNISVCSVFGALFRDDCLKEFAEIRRFLNGGDNSAVENLKKDLCSCANKLLENTPARFDNFDVCMLNVSHIHENYFDAVYAYEKCKNIIYFDEFNPSHDFCDGFRPSTNPTPNTTTKKVPSVSNAATQMPSGFTGIITSDPKPPTVCLGIGWIAFCGIAVVATFVFGTTFAVLYCRARRNNGSFGFKYFSKTENGSRSESDVTILL